MPFIVDLPPKPVNDFKTKIENVVETGLNNNSNSPHTIELDRDVIENIYLQDRFQSLVEEWEKNVAFESSISNIIEDDNFQQIVNMGVKVIPFIIDEIDKKPSILVWALNLITDAKVVSLQRKTIDDICKLWVKYWRENKIKISPKQ